MKSPVHSTRLLADIGLNSLVPKALYWDFVLDYLTSDYLYTGKNEYLRIDAKSLANSIGTVRQQIATQQITLHRCDDVDSLWSEYDSENHITIHVPTSFNETLCDNAALAILEVCYYFNNAHFLNTWLNQRTAFSGFKIDRMGIDYGNSSCDRLIRLLDVQFSVSQDVENFDLMQRLYS
jgi:hypothetical protein